MHCRCALAKDVPAHAYQIAIVVDCRLLLLCVSQLSHCCACMQLSLRIWPWLF